MKHTRSQWPLRTSLTLAALFLIVGGTLYFATVGANPGVSVLVVQATERTQVYATVNGTKVSLLAKDDTTFTFDLQTMSFV